jgi:hypothetical protein
VRRLKHFVCHIPQARISQLVSYSNAMGGALS